MSDLPRQKLYEIIATYGRLAYEDPRLCKALLLDLCRGYQSEINVLVDALDEQVAVDLLAVSGKVQPELLLVDLTKRLYENRGVPEELARWVVESWALALGVIVSEAYGTGNIKPGHQVDEVSSRLGNEEPRAVTHQTIIVSKRGGGQYTTISEAIKSAQPNTRIHVRQGLYKERLLIDKQLEIIGDGKREKIIIEGTNMPCVQMQTNYAVVRRLTLRCRAGLTNRQSHAVDIPMGQLLLSDCDITSDSSACVAIYGPTANPTIQNCTIHDGKGNGILVYENLQGVLDNCQIFSNARAGVKIKQGGKVVLRRCSIHDGSGSGLLICEGGEGIVEDCIIFGNANAGVEIRRGNNSELRRCQIRDGKGVGILICENSQVKVEDCEIFGNAYVGVEIKKVKIKQQPSVVIENCRINHNAHGAILVSDNSQVKVEHCDLTANSHGTWHIEAGSQVQRSRNQEDHADWFFKGRKKF